MSRAVSQNEAHNIDSSKFNKSEYFRLLIKEKSMEDLIRLDNELNS